MAPNAKEKEDLLEENEKAFAKLVAPHAEPWNYSISYFNVLIFGYWHVAAVYGLYLCFTSACWTTIAFEYAALLASIMGVMAGGHRLWAHRSYKAKLPLQILLIIFNSIAGQYSAINWIRDHRLHHKYSDTDADPHNATRGFFYSHIGWLLVRKHPEVRRRGRTIDMSDIMSNPILKFQKKYAVPILTLMCYVIPTAIPIYFWGETFKNAWHINSLRFVLGLNFISLINSAAHAFGNKPYDKSIMSTENNFVTLASLGEGFHNYHHVFPWDYRAAELGNHTFNITKKFIDFFAWVGWAYDLKTVSRDVVVKRVERTGDGSYALESENESSEEGSDVKIN